MWLLIVCLLSEARTYLSSPELAANVPVEAAEFTAGECKASEIKGNKNAAYTPLLRLAFEVFMATSRHNAASTSLNIKRTRRNWIASIDYSHKLSQPEREWLREATRTLLKTDEWRRRMDALNACALESISEQHASEPALAEAFILLSDELARPKAGRRQEAI